jgi:hypothetical protein
MKLTFCAASLVILAAASLPASASPITHAWAKAAEQCSGNGHPSACHTAQIYWDRLVRAGCTYDAPPHSFDPAGWLCRTR